MPVQHKKRQVTFTYRLRDEFTKGTEALIGSNKSITASIKGTHKTIQQEVKLSKVALKGYEQLIKSINRETISFGTRSKQSFMGAATGLSKLTRQAEAATRAIVNLRRVGGAMPMTAGGGVAPLMGGAPRGIGASGGGTAAGLAGAAGLAAGGGGGRGGARHGGTFTGISTRFLGYGSLFTLSTGVRAGFANFLEREKAEQAVRSRTDSDADFSRYTRLANRLSAQYPERPHQAWDAILSAKRAGLNVSQIEQLVPIASRFGVANRSANTLNKNVEHFVGWNFAMNPKGPNGKRKYSMNQLGNLITVGADISPWSADQINQFATKFRPYAGNLGMKNDMVSTLAITGLVQRATVDPNLVATGFRNVSNLIGRIPGNKRLEKNIRQIFGNQVNNLIDMKAGRVHTGMVPEMFKYLQMPGNKDKLNQFLNLGTIRSKLAMIPLSQMDWGELSQKQSEVRKKVNADFMGKAYREQMNTLPFQLERMMGSIEVVAQAFLGGAAKPVGAAAGVTTGIFETMGRFTKELGVLGTVLGTIALGLAGKFGGHILGAGLRSGKARWSSSLWGVAPSLQAGSNAGFFRKGTAEAIHSMGGFYSNVTGIKSPYTPLAQSLGGFKKLHRDQIAASKLAAKKHGRMGVMANRLSTPHLDKYSLGYLSDDIGRSPEWITNKLARSNRGITEAFMKGHINEASFQKQLNHQSMMFLQTHGLHRGIRNQKRVQSAQKAGVISNANTFLKEPGQAIAKTKSDYMSNYMKQHNSWFPWLKAKPEHARLAYRMARNDNPVLTPFQQRRFSMWRHVQNKVVLDSWANGPGGRAWEGLKKAGSFANRGAFGKGMQLGGRVLGGIGSLMGGGKRLGGRMLGGLAAGTLLTGIASSMMGTDSMSEGQRGLMSGLFSLSGYLGMGAMAASALLPVAAPFLWGAVGASALAGLGVQAFGQIFNSNTEHLPAPGGEKVIVVTDSGKKLAEVQATKSGELNIYTTQGTTGDATYVNFAID